MSETADRGLRTADCLTNLTFVNVKPIYDQFNLIWAAGKW